jgi:hypothetical protein
MNKLSKSIAVVGFLLISLSANLVIAQQQIVHNDFLFQLQSCERIETSITCLFTITNQIEPRLLSLDADDTIMFDNLGNERRGAEFWFVSTGSYRKQLLTNISAEARLVIDGVSPEASLITLLQVYAGGRFGLSDIALINSVPQPYQERVSDNFLYQLRGCSKEGLNVECLFTITNRAQDRQLSLRGDYSILYDNLANRISGSEFKFTDDGETRKTLITSIPMEAKLTFGVLPETTGISILEVEASGSPKFRNVPFTNNLLPYIRCPKTVRVQECPDTAVEPVCLTDGCAWSRLPDPPQGNIPIDRFRAGDGDLWKNPVRFQSPGGIYNSGTNQFDATQFAPAPYKNAIEGFFQIRYACEADWYSGAKDLPWVPANVVGAIEYCVYPDNIQEVVNNLRAVADKLACENNLPECNQ